MFRIVPRICRVRVRFCNAILRDWVDIVEDVVKSIPLELSVKSVDTDKVIVCDLKHVTIHDVLKDETDKEYIVKEISEKDGCIELNVEFTGSKLFAPEIHFLGAKPMPVNNEYLNLSNDTKGKTPFVWLVTNYDEDHREAHRIVPMKMVFLSWADEEWWDTEQHHKYAVHPMKKLADRFIEQTENDPLFISIYSEEGSGGYKTTPLDQFGVKRKNGNNYESDHEEKIIDDKLSGTGLTVTLKRIYDEECKC